MPTCKKCQSHFPLRQFLDGKERDFRSRKYCLTCSPFGRRNLCGPIKKNGIKIKGNPTKRICKKCSKEFITKNASTVCGNCKSSAVRAKRKQWAIDHLGGKCEKCGYSKCAKALHFHHINPTEKLMGLSYNWEKSIERVINEVNKCCLLCSNCHAELHAGQWNINDIRPCDGTWYTSST